MKKRTIKNKIIITVLSLGLIIALISGITIFKYLNSNLVDQKIDEVLKLNTEQVHELSQIFEKYKLFSKMLGTRTRVKEFLLNGDEVRGSELLDIFLTYQNEDSKYLAIYLLDKDGLCLTSTDPRFIGQNYGFRNYFKGAISGEAVVDFSIGKDSDQVGYYFSYPVLNDSGDVLGVLVTKYDGLEIAESIKKSQAAKGGALMLVDQYGVILSSTKEDRFLNSLGVVNSESTKKIEETQRFLGKDIKVLQYQEAQNIIENYSVPTTIEIYDEEDGDREIISVNKLVDLPFYLVSEISLSSVESLVANIITMIILIIVLFILIFSILMSKAVSVFIKPIEKFKLLTESLSGGDFSQKIEINTNDEFNDLALVFNKMTSKLKESYTILEQKIKERTKELETERGSLESKVKERTGELEALKNNLEGLVIERTQKLDQKLLELEKMNNLMVDREVKMVELKEENEKLKSKSD